MARNTGEVTPFGRAVERRMEELGIDQPELLARLEAAGEGMSRSTLWRLKTGKTEVSVRDLQVFAAVLGVDVTYFVEAEREQWEPEPEAGEERPREVVQLEEYVSNTDMLVRTLRTTPGGPLGLPLRLAILDGTRRLAEDAGAQVPPTFFEIRRRVLSGEFDRELPEDG